jgi:DNA repair protein RadD
MTEATISQPNKKPKPAAKVGEQPKWLKVQNRGFFHYEDAEGFESVRVDFLANSISYRMWLSIRKAKGRSDKFWRDHVGREPYPADVSEWLARQDELVATNEIMVRPRGRYFEIVGIKPAQREKDTSHSQQAA